MSTDLADSSHRIPPGEALETTKTLLLQIRRGDRAAQERLISRLLPGLRRWAHGRLPAQARALHETDDLVQVALIRALPRLAEFDPRRQGAFMAYLHAILMNLIREEIRRVSRRPQGGTLPEELPDERAAFLEKTLGCDALAAYERALPRLTEDQQQAVVLRLEFGFSNDEIATLLGRPSAGAVRMQVARGLARLSELMSADG